MRVALLAVALLAAWLAGCSSPPEGVVPPMDAEGRYVVRMDNAEFDPAVFHVPKGSTVSFVSVDTAHDVDGYVAGEDFPSFNSNFDPPQGKGGPIQPGDSFEWTFEDKGEYVVFCHLHHEEGMRADFEVM